MYGSKYIINKIQSTTKDFKEILIGTSTSLIINSIALPLGFIFFILLSKYFGTEGVGLYNQTAKTLEILTIFIGLGLPSTIIKFISTKVNRQSISKIYKQSFFIIGTLSIIISMIIFLFSKEIANTFFHDNKLTYALQYLAILLPFYALFNINIELIRSQKLIKQFGILSITPKIIRVILLAIIILLGIAGLYIPIYIFAISTITASLLSFMFTQKAIRSSKGIISFSISNTNLIKTANPMLITSLSSIILGTTDTIMIGHFLPTTSVGIYGIALSLSGLLPMIISSVYTILGPKISEYKENKQRLKILFKTSQKVTIGFTLPIFIGLILFPKSIIGLINSDFLTANTALIFLSIGYMIRSIIGTSKLFLNLLGHQKTLKNIMLIIISLNIILNYILIPLLGISGAGLSTMISIILLDIICYIYTKKYRVI